MTIFTLRSIKKDFGIKELLTDASFSLDEGDKVGLIGTNGSGKSTLLKMIAGYGVDRLWRSLGQYRRLRFIIGQKRYFVHVTFILQDFLSSAGNV